MRRALGTILVGLALPFFAWGQVAEEYHVKAAFVYNLTRFIEWPQETFASSTSPISICILGRNPFGDALSDMIRGKTVQQHPLIARSISDPADSAACQVLFVSASERKRFTSILRRSASTGILTVGDEDSFLSTGGIVNLKLEDNRVRLQINPKVAERQGLRISAHLLSLAEICRGDR